MGTPRTSRSASAVPHSSTASSALAWATSSIPTTSRQAGTSAWIPKCDLDPQALLTTAMCLDEVLLRAGGTHYAQQGLDAVARRTRLLLEHGAFFQLHACLRPLAPRQVHLSQQAERKGAHPADTLLLKMRQALLGQLLCLLRIALRHEEQACQQIAGPVHARLFAQLLAERHTRFQQGLGLLVLALISGHPRPFAEVKTALPAVALCATERGGLLQPGRRQRILPPDTGHTAQQTQARGDAGAIVTCSIERQTLLTQRLCSLEVIDGEGHGRCVAQDLRLHRGFDPGAHGQGLFQEGLPLPEVATLVPEDMQGGTQAQHLLGWRTPLVRRRLALGPLQQKAEGCPQVLVFSLQQREPSLLLAPPQLGPGLLGPCQIVLGVRPPARLDLPPAGANFQSQLSHRLQHPPTPLAILLSLLPQQALIHQRLQSLQDVACQPARRATDLFSGRPVPPIDKDCQAAEEHLFLLRE